MRDHRLVGRAPPRPAALQQRGVEPAAVLVGALEIDIRRPHPVGAVAQNEGMGRAGIEPDIEDVGDLRPALRLGTPSRKRALAPSANQASAPSARKAATMRAFTASSRRISTSPSPLAHEAGERHAPGPLAREHPVRAVRDHRAQRFCPVFGYHFTSSSIERSARSRIVARARPSRRQRPVDGDEPLRRVAEDERRLGPPAMRIGMREPPARDQRAGLDQLLDHARLASPSLPLASKVSAPPKKGRSSRKLPSSSTL